MSELGDGVDETERDRLVALLIEHPHFGVSDASAEDEAYGVATVAEGRTCALRVGKSAHRSWAIRLYQGAYTRTAGGREIPLTPTKQAVDTVPVFAPGAGGGTSHVFDMRAVPWPASTCRSRARRRGPGSGTRCRRGRCCCGPGRAPAS